jgi:hypothetical protein
MSVGATPLTDRRKPRRFLWLWVLGSLLVLLLAVSIGGKMWVDGYLRSEKFRAFISRKAGDTLEAKAEVAPLTFSTQGFYTEGLNAQGREDSWFSDMRIEQIRADVSTRRFWEKVWQVEEVEIQRARIVLEGPRLPKEPKVKKPKGARDEPRERGFLGELLPNRVEIGSAVIRDAGLQWKDGRLEGTAIRVAPQDKGWNFTVNGGTVAHETLPPLEITQARIRYREPSLFIQEAELRQPGGGTARVSGEVNLENSLDLHAKLEGVTMTPYLAEDWRARLHGKVNGEVRVQTPLPARGSPLVTGSLNLTEGILEALPVLDSLATFTRTTQFRRLNLTRASADFRQESETLQVRRFIAESAGLIRIEGDFDVLGENIDGNFQIGVTPSTLQWLPGSQEKVFVVSRDGYLWAPMRLTGSVKKPKEDLSARLGAAAKSALFEAAEDTVKDAADVAKEAAKSAVDLLLGR